VQRGLRWRPSHPPESSFMVSSGSRGALPTSTRAHFVHASRLDVVKQINTAMMASMIVRSRAIMPMRYLPHPERYR
jgi:hypothetical protein